jgi:hypothetical protein
VYVVTTKSINNKNQAMKSSITFWAACIFALLSPMLQAQTMVVRTVAGNGTDGFAGDGGPATAAIFNNPTDVATDAAGNLYIADQRNHRIRKVDAATGIITTIVGTGAMSSSGDGGPAMAASLWYPSEVAVDGLGNIYISEQIGHRIRKVEAATGTISTIVGGGTSNFYEGMPGTALRASFRPAGLTVDHGGSCYFIDDTISRIIRCNAVTGMLTTVAGTAIPGYSGDGGPATSARLNNLNFYPGISIALGSANDVYISDVANYRIRKVSPSSGIINTYAGNGTPSTSGDGGPATMAGLHLPNCIATDNANNLYFATYNTIRRVDALTNIITTVAGGGMSMADGVVATTARIYSPGGMAANSAGNVYYTDAQGWVRVLSPGCSSVSAGVISGHATSYCDSAVLSLSLVGASTGADITYQWQQSADSVVWTATGSGATLSHTLYTTTYLRAIVTCTSGSTADTSIPVTIHITPSPVAGTITGSTTLCPGTSAPWSSTVPAGTWTSSSPTIATIAADGTVTAIAPGTAILTYSVANSCGTNMATAVVAVNTLPLAGTITGSLVLCQETGTALASTQPGGSWLSAAPAVASVSAGGVVAGIGAGTATISYTVSNSCGSATAIVVVTVNTAPEPGSITGADTVCAGNTLSLSASVTGGIWSSSNGAIATVDAAGTVSTLAAGTSQISYAVTNDCGTTYSVKTVYVLPATACLTQVFTPAAAGQPLVFPNPSDGHFSLLLPGNEGHTAAVTITNALGSVVYRGTLPTGIASRLHLPLPAGVYILSARTATLVSAVTITTIP